jgi:hypothetical protein
MTWWRAAAVITLWAAMTWAAAADAQDTPDAPAASVCDGGEEVTWEGRRYIACGAAGLVEVSADGQATRAWRVGGQVVGVFIQGGQVWAQLVRQEARPLAELAWEAGAGLPPDAPSRPPLAPPPPHRSQPSPPPRPPSAPSLKTEAMC